MIISTENPLGEISLRDESWALNHARFEDKLIYSVGRAWQLIAGPYRVFRLPCMYYSYVSCSEKNWPPEWRWRTYGYNSAIVDQVLGILTSENSRDVLFLASDGPSAIPGHAESELSVASKNTSELPGVLDYLVKEVEEYHLTKRVCPARVGLSLLTRYLLRKNATALRELSDARKALNDFIARAHVLKKLRFEGISRAGSQVTRGTSNRLASFRRSITRELPQQTVEKRPEAC